jgi:hypothetical protein
LISIFVFRADLEDVKPQDAGMGVNLLSDLPVRHG